MATPPIQPAPISFQEQELRMVRIVLQARGWEILDARGDDSELNIIARKKIPGKQLTVLDVAREK